MTLVALGIGINGAIVAAAYRVLREPLPFRADRQLYAIGRTFAANDPSSAAPAVWGFKGDEIATWIEADDAAFSAAVFAADRAVVTVGDRSEYVRGATASGNLAQVLGIEPVRGRWFSESETWQNVIVISTALWTRHFHGDPGVVGQSLTLADASWTIVGIASDAEALPRRAEYWTPYRGGDGEIIARIHGRSPGVVAGRLALAAGRADSLAGRTGTGVVIVPLRDHLYGSASGIVALLLVAGCLVLVVAIANVSNLSLVRCLARVPELSVRASLGATKRHLVGLVVAEHAVLGLVGTGLAVVIAVVATRLLGVYGGTDILAFAELRFGLPHVLLVVLLGMVVAAATSITPALAAARHPTGPLIGGTSLTLGRTHPLQRLQRGLVSVQLATTLVLVTATMLVVSSVRRLLEPSHLGFQRAGVMVTTLDLSSSRYRPPGAREAFLDELINRLDADPSIVRLAVGHPPIVGGRGPTVSDGFDMIFLHRTRASDPASAVWLKAVDTGYARMYEIPIRSGRSFAATDDAAGVPVVTDRKSVV